MAGRGLILAAPASGSGKTLITAGLLRHLSCRGTCVAAAKAGPDYIDPTFHAAASGRPCVNLDLWAMRPATLAGLVAELEICASLVLCEGVMGLFDGTGLDGEAAVSVTWPPPVRDTPVAAANGGSVTVTERVTPTGMVPAAVMSLTLDTPPRLHEKPGT